ncbi:MAG TPA: hypothetical protein VF587_07155 [Solirubrobacteraceae bacterium]|jgi:hypothetical protein
MFAVLAAAALALAPPTGEELRPHFDSPLAVAGDARLWSGARPGEDDFRLVLERGAERRIVANPVSPSGMPSADLGTGADGGLVVVFTTCPRRRDCDIHAVDGDDPAAKPKPVRGAARRDVLEQAPTIDDGRLAWAADGKVLLREDGRTRRVRRALAPRGQEVEQLELSGRHLAALSSYIDDSTGDFGAWILRIDGRTLFRGGGGLSGKHPTGLSFASGRLGYHVSCPGEPSVCARDGGAFRYEPRRRRLERAPHAVTGDPEGFQLLPGDRALIVRSDAIEEVELPFAAAP